MGTVGALSKIVASFVDFSGHFIARVPSLYLSQALTAFSGMIDISSRPVTVRVLVVSGRLKKIADETVNRILWWRNGLSMDYSVPRKEILDTGVRKAIQELLSLPAYA